MSVVLGSPLRHRYSIEKCQEYFFTVEPELLERFDSPCLVLYRKCMSKLGLIKSWSSVNKRDICNCVLLNAVISSENSFLLKWIFLAMIRRSGLPSVFQGADDKCPTRWQADYA